MVAAVNATTPFPSLYDFATDYCAAECGHPEMLTVISCSNPQTRRCRFQLCSSTIFILPSSLIFFVVVVLLPISSSTLGFAALVLRFCQREGKSAPLFSSLGIISISPEFFHEPIDSSGFNFSVPMSCFACGSFRRKDFTDLDEDLVSRSSSNSLGSGSSSGNAKEEKAFSSKSEDNGRRKGSLSLKTHENGNFKGNTARSFTFRELAMVTKNFREVNLLGEGGFGRVYRGCLDSGQIVAVKQLNLDGHQGNQEFIVEVLMLSLLHHPNLVTLIGYCTDGDQRLLVYEYMAMGSVEDHLFDIESDGEPLDWSTRMKIAVGAARGLEYLHCKANPPVIYRDLKSANILLDENFNPKLSDFGLAKLGPVGDNTHVSTRVMGTYGYCAPEYAMSGKLTLKSDIYGFGVVLLELITGRKVIDSSKKPGEQNLIVWSRPFLRDKRKFLQLADPLLRGRFPQRGFQHAVAITAMCLHDQASSRPLISDIVVALEYLASQSNKQSKSGARSSSSSPLQQEIDPSPTRENKFGRPTTM